MSDIARIGLRHDDLSDWESGNPTLVTDETVLIDDTGMVARGDGSAFNTSYDEVGTLGSTGMVLGKYVGEIYFRPGAVVAVSASHPGVCLTNFDSYQDISATNYLDLVSWLRSQQLYYLEDLTGEASEWTASVSGSNVTMPDNTSSNAILEMLYEDALVHGGGGETPSYTSWRSINVAGTDYAITSVNTSTRVIAVTGSPTTGSQTVKVYPHRIAGSSTTARLFSQRGRVLVGAGLADIGSGLRRRDYMQGHWHEVYGTRTTYTTSPAQGIDAGGSYSPETMVNDDVRDPKTDGTNGTPRTDANTEPRSYGVHMYMHAGRYSA